MSILRRCCRQKSSNQTAAFSFARYTVDIVITAASTFSSHMWIEGATNVALLFREALQTGLWGLQCPLHCHPASFSSLALSWLLGLLLGFLISSAFWIWLLIPVADQPISSPVRQVVQSAALRARRRLEGYRVA